MAMPTGRFSSGGGGVDKPDSVYAESKGNLCPRLRTRISAHVKIGLVPHSSLRGGLVKYQPSD